MFCDSIYNGTIKEVVMNAITANDLKTRGVSALEESLLVEPDAMITVRGKNKYVVMHLEQYRYLREMELEAALLESRRDLENGNFLRETAEEHLDRVTDR